MNFNLTTIKNFFSGCKRVLKVSKKPSEKEYLGCLKFATIMAFLFGLIGLGLTIIVIFIY